MSFREKTHWVAFTALLAGFGWYYVHYPWSELDQPAGLIVSAAMLSVATVIVLGLMTIAATIMAIRSPREANLSADERDRTIHWRGTHIAYYPLVVGVWANVIFIFYRPSPAAALNLLIGTVLVAELIRVGAQLWLYRRGQ